MPSLLIYVAVQSAESIKKTAAYRTSSCRGDTMVSIRLSLFFLNIMSQLAFNISTNSVPMPVSRFDYHVNFVVVL